MTGRDDFLSRWSRRKREAGKESAPDEEGQAAETKSVQPVTDAPLPEMHGDAEQPGTEGQEKDQDEPAFDLSKLPSIESITAETDIRPFLAAGVPASLRQAALRRVWVADPAIRDFIGIAENQWDFTPGGNAPGFDFSTPAEEIRRAVAQMFTGSSSGEKQRPRDESGFDIEQPLEAPDPASGDEPDQIAVSSKTLELDAAKDSPELTPPVEQLSDSPAREMDVASQNDDATQNENSNLVARRSHGGAMPK
jgi:hypothetical protein